MENKAYWAKRAELLELAQQQKGKEYYETLERQYKAAMDAVEADISKWYIRLADNNELTAEGARKLLKRGELKEFKWGLEEYIKRGKENAIDGRWIKELENASAKVHITRLEAIKTHVRQHIEELYASEQKGLTGHLRGVYERGYYHTAYDIHKGLGVAWNIDAINPKVVDKILSNPWALDKKVFSSRIWEHKTKLINSVQTELTQAVLTGKSPQRSIQDIVKAFGVSKSQASCLVMTETAAIAQLSKRDCYDDLGVEKYEIIATLDLKTSEICQEMDGKVFDTKDRIVGVTCAPFHPRCRTTDCPYFDDEFEHMFERAARDENGQVYYVPADLTYKDWKWHFVDGEPLPKTIVKPSKAAEFDEKVIDVPAETIKQKKPLFKPAATIEEAEIYAKQFVVEKVWSNHGNVSFKGMSLDLANELNETLTNLFAEMDVPKLENIEPMNFKSKIFKDAKDALYCYRPLQGGGLYFNPYINKTRKALEKHVEEGKKALEYVRKNLNKINGVNRRTAETYINAGRALVGDTSEHVLKTTIEHEIGHHLQYTRMMTNQEIVDIVKQGFNEYGLKVSGYATSSLSEYIAESFAAFRNGEAGRIDPKLKEVFERWIK